MDGHQTLEQHFIHPEALDGILPEVSFEGLDIIEFGAGRGALTLAMLDAGARSVEAWEIDPGLGRPTDDPRLAWLCRDILTATRESLRGRAVAAFPPCATLPFLLDLCRDVPDLLLMVPPKRLESCAAMGMRILEDLGGDAFVPPSAGRHLVVARGFYP